MTNRAPIALPVSYHDLNGSQFTQIRVSHHPPSSRTPTPIIILTLYRPGKHNAFTETMREEIVSAFGMFDADDRVKCIVVTGHGKMFCAGADLEIGFSDGKAMRPAEHRDGGGRTALAIHHCRKPTICALIGSAVGIGITMTLPMTIRIALSSAKIGFVFARRGLVMEATSSFFLPRLIGYSKALHLVTTGATYRADNKLFDGLFSETRDSPEEVMGRALEVAQEIVENISTVGAYLCRELMWRGPGTAEASHLLDSRIIYELFGSKDNTEGVRSFMEKRPPNFAATMGRDAPPSYPWWKPIDVGPEPKPEKPPGNSKL